MKNAESEKLKPSINPLALPENKYKQGEIVCERVRPSQKLVVEQYLDRIYYCKLKEAPHRKAIVYLERDLMADNPNLVAN